MKVTQLVVSVLYPNRDTAVNANSPVTTCSVCMPCGDVMVTMIALTAQMNSNVRITTQCLVKLSVGCAICVVICIYRCIACMYR